MGEVSRLFLEPNTDGTYSVVGLAAGKQDALSGAVAEAATTCQSGTPGDGYCLTGASWPSPAQAVGYKVYPNTADVSGEESAVVAGFDTWENDTLSSIDYRYDGATTISCTAFDGTQAVYWSSASCNAACGSPYLACATWWYSGVDLIHFDVEFNDNESWAIGAVSGKYDIQSVAVHEAGHTLGLDHPKDCAQVMGVVSSTQGCLAPGTTKRNLGTGDQNGVRALYPPPPPPVSWNFEKLEGDGYSISPFNSPFNPDVGKAPVAIQFGATLQLFYYDATNGDLRRAWAAPNWQFQVLDGAGDTGQTPAVVVYNSVLHVFYYDATNGNGNLRHAWSSGNLTSWTFQTVDGAGGLNPNLGQTPTATVFGGAIQLFYYDASNTNLRHAWSTNGTSWSFLNLDGDLGSIGGLNADLGYDPAVTVNNDVLQLFYYAAALPGQPYGSLGNLRHAWKDGAGWHFENLDGDPGSIGGLNADLGRNPAVTNYTISNYNTLQLLYYDATNTNLRHAWADAAGWHFENLEGDPGSISRYSSDVGGMPTIISSGGVLQSFYYEYNGGNLRHGWSDATGWHFENLDGMGGSPGGSGPSGGRVNRNVGHDPNISEYSGGLQLYYYDATNGNLRHAWPQ